MMQSENDLLDAASWDPHCMKRQAMGMDCRPGCDFDDMLMGLDLEEHGDNLVLTVDTSHYDCTAAIRKMCSG